MATISLKLLVNKKTNRVVFAESDHNFVDVLFSFLTLPMGTIIRLLEKQSSSKCMNKLYESVENLDAEYFETTACTKMLLEPKSTAEQQCENLPINPDDLRPRQLYRCPSFDCFTNAHRLFSSVKGARCLCGQIMNVNFHWLQTHADAEDGVFLKGATRFIISDDLHVEPANTVTTLSLLQKLGIKDANSLDKKVVKVGRKEVLSLLKMLVQSKMPLTDAFLSRPSLFKREKEEHDPLETVEINSEHQNEAKQAKTANVKLKLIQNKITNKVLYAEAGQDFVDIIFSFLTFPLGAIVKLFHENSSIGCVDNLYKSVEKLSGAGENCIKSEECKNMLLSPKLFPHFDCGSQLLRVEPMISQTCSVHRCETCFNMDMKKCIHNVAKVKTTEINPKLPTSGTENGGGFAKRSVKFMVSNGMAITPLSPVAGVNIMKEMKTPFCSVIEKEATFGEADALNLLRACLLSRTALDGMLRLKKLQMVSC